MSGWQEDWYDIIEGVGCPDCGASRRRDCSGGRVHPGRVRRWKNTQGIDQMLFERTVK